MPKTITVLYDDYVKMQADLATTRAELAEVKDALAHEEAMREFDANRYEKILCRQGRGYAKKLSTIVELEMLAIRDIAQAFDEVNRRRVIRRLDCVAEYLREFTGEE